MPHPAQAAATHSKPKLEKQKSVRLGTSNDVGFGNLARVGGAKYHERHVETRANSRVLIRRPKSGGSLMLRCSEEEQAAQSQHDTSFLQACQVRSCRTEWSCGQPHLDRVRAE